MKQFFTENKKALTVLAVILVFVINLSILNSILTPVIGYKATALDYKITFELKTPSDSELQLFYNNGEASRFDESHSEKLSVKGSTAYQKVIFDVPSSGIEYIRLDLGNSKNASFNISEIKIESFARQLIVDYENIPLLFTVSNDVGKISAKDYSASVKTIGNDPFISNPEPIAVTESRMTTPIVIFFASVLLTIAFYSIYLFVMNKITEQKDTLPASYKDLLFVAAVMLILFSSLLFGFLSYNNIDEPVPALNLKSFMNFPSEFEEYYNNTFPLKNKFSGMYNTIQTSMGISQNEEVIIGDWGWLFPKATLPAYKNTNTFSTKQLDEMMDNLLNMERVCKNNGMQFYIVVAPNKNTIYPEKMPFNISRVNRTQRLQQIYEHLYKYSDLKVIQVRDQLIEAKKDGRTYYKNDTHWNQFGAYIAANQLVEFIKIDADEATKELYWPDMPTLDIKQFETQKRKTKMEDLAILAGRDEQLTETETIYSVKGSGINVVTANEPANLFGEGIWREMNDRNEAWQLSHYIKISNSTSPGPYKLYMLRDSFAVNMIPFLNEIFSEATYTWSYDFDDEAVLAENPDIVVYEISENSLESLLND